MASLENCRFCIWRGNPQTNNVALEFAARPKVHNCHNRVLNNQITIQPRTKLLISHANFMNKMMEFCAILKKYIQFGFGGCCWSIRILVSVVVATPQCERSKRATMHCCSLPRRLVHERTNIYIQYKNILHVGSFLLLFFIVSVIRWRTFYAVIRGKNNK